MKILHIGLASHYTEKMTYQDQMLVDIHCRDGHEVMYVSDTMAYVDGVLCDVGREEKVMDNEARLVRIEFDYVINKIITQKIQKCNQLLNIIYDFKPDVILYHGIGGYALKYISKYKKNNPDVIIYADCHASFENSSLNIISKLFNKYINGFFIKRALHDLEKILYVGEDSKKYLKKMYKIDDSMMEWFPLGGIIQPFEKKSLLKRELLEQLGLPMNTIIVCHSGKLDINKNTDWILDAIKLTNNKRIALIIFGSIPNDSTLNEKIKTIKNVFFLGWKSGQEILDILTACDIYCQPGSVSATLQNALCCGCLAITYPWPSYLAFPTNTIKFIRNSNDIKELFDEYTTLSFPEITEKQKNSYDFAKKYLDYNKIAARIYKL